LIAVLSVTVDQTGDRAYADDETGALLAAVTIAREAYEGRGGTFKPTVTFRDADDNIIYLRVPEATLWTQKGSA